MWLQNTNMETQEYGSFHVFVFLLYGCGRHLYHNKHKCWFNIFPLVQGCIKHRQEAKCFKLDLVDLIANECAVCPDFTNM